VNRRITRTARQPTPLWRGKKEYLQNAPGTHSGE
jgi:hypothetical protein